MSQIKVSSPARSKEGMYLFASLGLILHTVRVGERTVVQLLRKAGVLLSAGEAHGVDVATRSVGHATLPAGNLLCMVGVSA